jgi:lipopolysaccharide/colanic/teichoic acid biosynthesis glycosyltransferase
MLFTDWMKLDLEYIDHWSIYLDFKIMARTLPTIFKATGQ